MTINYEKLEPAIKPTLYDIINFEVDEPIQCQTSSYLDIQAEVALPLYQNIFPERVNNGERLRLGVFYKEPNIKMFFIGCGLTLVYNYTKGINQISYNLSINDKEIPIQNMEEKLIELFEMSKLQGLIKLIKKGNEVFQEIINITKEDKIW